MVASAGTGTILTGSSSGECGLLVSVLLVPPDRGFDGGRVGEGRRVVDEVEELRPAPARAPVCVGATSTWASGCERPPLIQRPKSAPDGCSSDVNWGARRGAPRRWEFADSRRGWALVVATGAWRPSGAGGPDSGGIRRWPSQAPPAARRPRSRSAVLAGMTVAAANDLGVGIDADVGLVAVEVSVAALWPWRASGSTVEMTRSAAVPRTMRNTPLSPSATSWPATLASSAAASAAAPSRLWPSSTARAAWASLTRASTRASRGPQPRSPWPSLEPRTRPMVNDRAIRSAAS